MLSVILKMLAEKPVCRHCDNELTLCHAPPVHVGDGLGWGSEYLFICLNDQCPLFVTGWENIENNYGHVGSYRYMRLPDSNEEYNMMVAGKDAFTGSIVDVEQIKVQDARYRQERDAVSKLDTCLEHGDLQPVLYLLLDDHAKISDRKRAVELLTELNDLACVEPLRNHKFRNTDIEQAVNMALAAIFKAHFMKECPFCAELIKARAKVCKHCQKELG